MRLRVSLIAAALALASTTAAAAADRRYAVVIGSNSGAADDQPLRYAERDARRVAETLLAFGGLAPADLQLVLGKDARSVVRELQSTIAAIDAGADTVLLVYFSGHADGEALHLGGTRLPLARLRAVIAASSATVSLLIVDACHSGELTQVKGARPAEPFEITADDRLETEGIAIIASSAASEDAHESERLRGGVFTHHLVVGLRGAADDSGDRRVTLREVYDYTYQQTLRATTRTRSTQHPTFAFQLRGRDDLVLTRLSSAAAGRLRFGEGGEFAVLEASARGRTVAELTVEGKTEIILEPGEYLVRLRTDDAVYEVRVSIRAGEVSVIELGNMRAQPYGGAARKGDPASEAPALTSAVLPGQEPRGYFAGIAVGRGAAHITSGASEQRGNEIGCCLSLSPLHLQVEAGLQLNPRWAASALVRYGRSGATLPGHAAASTALLARLSRADRGQRSGWVLHADLGVGVIRHDVELAQEDGAIDSHAMGPLLIGAGARWGYPLGNNLQLAIDTSLYAGIPVVELEDTKTGSAVRMELTLGLNLSL